MQNQPIVHLISADEAQGKTKELFTQMEKSTGQVPKWMRVMANCPDTLSGFLALFKSVMDDAPTDQLLKWKVAYVVSQLNKCDFCVDVTRMKLKQLGLDEQSMKNIEKACGEKECVAIEYAKAVTTHAYKISPEIIEKLKQHFTDQQIVEITSVVGLFNFINRFNDALRILPE